MSCDAPATRLHAGVLLAKEAAGGTWEKLGALFGLTAQAVGCWDRVPAERVVEVEKKTGVPREQLRPDLYRRGGKR